MSLEPMLNLGSSEIPITKQLGTSEKQIAVASGGATGRQMERID
jgi:hypothetical protein